MSEPNEPNEAAAMKAARRQHYGGPEVISVVELPVPRPAANEILVRVHNATINRSDCALLSASPFIMRFFAGLRAPKLKTLGTDFAGSVAAIGDGVTGFEKGDRVWGFCDMGLASHAEYLTISQAAAVTKIPDGVDFVTAAASIEGAFYAHNFINKVDVAVGSRVLVNGATGGIGSALLQFCKNAGATVTAVGNTKNLERLTSLGADKTIDYEREDFTRGDGPYDFVFDAVGKSTFGKCKRLLAPKGVYMSSELGPFVQNPFLALATPLLPGRKVVFPLPSDPKGFLQQMGALLAAGRFAPLIDHHVGLDGIVEAFRYVASGQKTGNVVLDLAS
jgi:NADPH:quinone reductase-like Zn-dependent oxidoreductase